MNRFFLIALSLIILMSGVLLFGQYSVYRYPSLSIDPIPSPQKLSLENGLFLNMQGAHLKTEKTKEGAWLLRAFKPDVALTFNMPRSAVLSAKTAIHISIENIHPEAILDFDANAISVEEKQNGLLRKITLSDINQNTNKGQNHSAPFHIRWRFPIKSKYRFASLGDTGGNEELSWGLKRAKALGADFILHLGDGYYESSEVGMVGARMNESEIPVYTANGNHDFRGPEGNSITTFLNNVGPLNARFQILGHCFINLDTGAYMYPPHLGERASIIAAEIVMQKRHPQRCTDTIVFTHKPVLSEPIADFPQRDHSLKGRDAAWLLSQIQALKSPTLIVGHIHKDFSFEQNGFQTFVNGSGLAHADLLGGKKEAKILLVDIEKGKPIKTTWQLNDMPLDYHCSKKIYHRLIRSSQKKDQEQAEKTNQACLKRLH